MREILVAESGAIGNIPVTAGYGKAVELMVHLRPSDELRLSNSGRISEIVALMSLAKNRYSQEPITVVIWAARAA